MPIYTISLLTDYLYRKAHKLDPSPTLTLVRKWGPSTETIISMMRDPSIVGTLELRARQSAADICSKPWYIGLSPDGLLGSTVLFTRPHRTFMPNSTVIRSSSLGISFIPTKYLSGIFELSQMALPNEKSLYLYDKLTFPFPFSTRSTIGHGHEILMHRRLCSAGAGLPISIFSKENVEVQMGNRRITGVRFRNCITYFTVLFL